MFWQALHKMCYLFLSFKIQEEGASKKEKDVNEEADVLTDR